MVNKRRPQIFSIMFDMVSSWFHKPEEYQQDRIKWYFFLLLLPCLCATEVKQTKFKPVLWSPGSNDSKVVVFSLPLLSRDMRPPARSPYCPFPPSRLWYPEFPAETTICHRILWSQCQSLVFLSGARALTPDLKWLLPWRSIAEITVNARLWYSFECLEENTATARISHTRMCVCTCVCVCECACTAEAKHVYDFPIKAVTSWYSSLAQSLCHKSSFWCLSVWRAHKKHTWALAWHVVEIVL